VKSYADKNVKSNIKRNDLKLGNFLRLIGRKDSNASRRWSILRIFFKALHILKTNSASLSSMSEELDGKLRWDNSFSSAAAVNNKLMRAELVAFLRGNITRMTIWAVH